MSKCCEQLFDILDSFAENNKRRAAVWPLQIMLLVISPKVLEEIVNADSGAPCSPRHSRKKTFLGKENKFKFKKQNKNKLLLSLFYFVLDSLKKALAPHSSSRQLTEAAAVTAVKLCKVSTYIHFLDSGNVVFALVQSVLNDLKVSESRIFQIATM